MSKLKSYKENKIYKKPEKIKLNRYEQEQNFNLFIIKLFCVILVLVNLSLSVFKPYKLPLKSPLVWLNCIVIINMAMKATGWSILRIDNSVNILPWVLVKIVDVFLTLVLGFGTYNWISLAIVRSLEILFIIFLVFDQINYEFEVEIEE